MNMDLCACVNLLFIDNFTTTLCSAVLRTTYEVRCILRSVIRCILLPHYPTVRSVFFGIYRTYTYTDRHRCTHTDTHTERETERQRERETERQTDRHRHTQTDADRQTDRHTERHRQTDKQTDTHTHTRRWVRYERCFLFTMIRCYIEWCGR